MTEWLDPRRRPWTWALAAAVLVAFLLGRWSGSDRPAPAADPHASPAGEHQTDKHGAHAGSSDDEATTWTCAMHPQIRRPEPGSCPICGMDLVPVSEAQAGEAEPARITLSERAKTLARVRTAPVTRLEHAHVERRLLGRVAQDETRLHTVTTWIDGRIDTRHVEVTGERVRKGQVVATLYSPEIYTAHQDLLEAARQVRELKAATPTARSAARAALAAARQKLRLLGMGAAELERMAAADAPWRQVPIRSPYAGTIVERLVTEGSYVTTGTGLYRLADLSVVWVQLDAYESDLPYLQIGAKVQLEVRGLPGSELTGTVAFVDPVVDPRTRTSRIRVEVPNRDGRLLPGMFAEAVLQGRVEGIGDRPLAIPDSAPLFTGRRSLVYVEVPGADRPTYEARIVKLGPKVDGAYTVIAGLQEGERVVTRGAFAIDADLQIQGGPSMMSVPDDTEPGPYAQALMLSDAARAQLAPVLRHALAVHEALAADDLAAARQAAGQLAQAIGGMDPELPEPARPVWARLGSQLERHARRMADAETLPAARAQLDASSQALIQLLETFGNPLEEPVRLAYCPMAFDDRGAHWVQRGAQLANPYFGEKMHDCGELRGEVHSHGYLTQYQVERTPRPAPSHAH